MTRRILDNYTDETGIPVVPTFAAYMLENGFTRYIDAQNADGFTLWQAERWEDFWIEQGHAGAMPLFPTGSDRAAFIDWLDQRAHDHAARRDVEAA